MLAKYRDASRNESEETATSREGRPRQAERNRAKRGPRKERTEEKRNGGAGRKRVKKARGWPAVSSAEKRQSLKHATTYQAVNGIAMPRLFFTWVDFTTRDITLPFPLPSSPFPFPSSPVPFSPAVPPPTTVRPADLSRVWPLSCSFYITFSVHVRQRD